MKFAFRAAAGLVLAFSTLAASAQAWPSRPITMVMPYSPGGPGDTITRVFAAAMQKTLGQQVVVDNTAGASGTIGTAKVARSAADGYTLLMIHVSHATNLAMYKGLPYHPVDDFEPIGSATSGPMVIVARNDFPPKDLPEFIAYVRANAAKVNLAHAGVGSASHLCGLMMMNALNVKLNEIPYKGTGPALADLMGGNISFGLYAPKGTPRPVLEQLTAALQKAVADPEVRAKLEGMGISAVNPEQATPAALRAHLKQEIDTLGPLLVKAGVKAN
ncbi:MAG: tctC [Ramlibacter sp.]|nr:tctC [Ramlibacter sp.]